MQKTKEKISMSENSENCPICGKTMILKTKQIHRNKNFFTRKHSTTLELTFECENCIVQEN
jgi:predicted RNA-binding Zn-ribbon protein involved in translation (DUF1610 family)